MKLGQVQVKVIEDTSAANLEAAINAFLTTSGERTFLSIEYMKEGASYSALIAYME